MWLLWWIDAGVVLRLKYPFSTNGLTFVLAFSLIPWPSLLLSTLLVEKVVAAASNSTLLSELPSVTLTAGDVNPWNSLRNSKFMVFWRVSLSLIAGISAIAALYKLMAFIRLQGPRVSVPQLVLLIILIGSLYRCTYVAIDPIYQRYANTPGWQAHFMVSIHFPVVRLASNFPHHILFFIFTDASVVAECPDDAAPGFLLAWHDGRIQQKNEWVSFEDEDSIHCFIILCFGCRNNRFSSQSSRARSSWLLCRTLRGYLSRHCWIFEYLVRHHGS